MTISSDCLTAARKSYPSASGPCGVRKSRHPCSKPSRALSRCLPTGYAGNTWQAARRVAVHGVRPSNQMSELCHRRRTEQRAARWLVSSQTPHQNQRVALTQKTKSQLDGRCACANRNATFSRIVTQLQRHVPVSPAKDSGVTSGVVNLAGSDAFVHESTEYVGMPKAVHRGMRSRYTPAKFSRQQRFSTRQVPAAGNRSAGGVFASG
eukprot:scaffold90061_cov66-Phaeocystis_antarctica.AAC.25